MRPTVNNHAGDSKLISTQGQYNLIYLTLNQIHAFRKEKVLRKPATTIEPHIRARRPASGRLVLEHNADDRLCLKTRAEQDFGFAFCCEAAAVPRQMYSLEIGLRPFNCRFIQENGWIGQTEGEAYIPIRRFTARQSHRLSTSGKAETKYRSCYF